MKKISSLFQRNYEGDHLVRDEIVPGAEWVVAGEGTATRKWDGTACMVKDQAARFRPALGHGQVKIPLIALATSGVYFNVAAHHGTEDGLR